MTGQLRQLTPRPTSTGQTRQSLAGGAVGAALLDIERAATGHGTWQTAHQALAVASSGGITSTQQTHLYYGAPAFAFAITGAHQHHPGSYRDALAMLDEMVSTIVQARLAAAHARIDARQLPALSEFDTIRGLAGLGAHLLRRDHRQPLLRDVLAYLVRLTQPIHDDGDELPGWWTHLDPGGNPSPDYPGGHANTGMAHGIGGPLALLALAANRGFTVPGHHEAIARIRDWLDRWQQTTDTGPCWNRTETTSTWWPYWITRTELRTGRLQQRGPQRPSWCYGTPGLGRAQQLAAIATRDAAWKHAAETALVDALTDSHQVALLTDNSLCHGLAGAAYIARLAAADSTSPQLARVADQLAAAADRRRTPRPDTTAPLDTPQGFLEGTAGTALALRAHLLQAAPRTSWDSSLLINASI
ncbi:lanthionine synthetase C family protein [Kribbella sp. NBC_01245]|uniref:lanthionine synthetase C family protein n=1 Tax=Kribbella sp. NBC_01245 TaxID=2903578 RepID=UPI002E29F82A|nr:lanthionine synthetase C family protein [Kribbella sp. NBC_01245]